MRAGRGLLAVAACALVAACGPGERDAAPARAGGPVASRQVTRPRAAVPAPSGRGFIGVVIAREQADLAARQAGEVVEVRVRLGDRVEPGQVLVRLDERPIREAHAIARAELSAAQAEGERARAELAEARDRLARRRALHGSVAQEELNAAGYAVDKAGAMRDRARAAVAHQRARLGQLARQLADATITAPFAGAVAMRYIDPGVVVEAGTPLVRLIAADRPWVRFAVPAEQRAVMAPGARVSVAIESPALQGQPVEAVVRHIAPALDPSSQMFLVEAELAPSAQQAERIHPGLAARIRP